MIPIGLAGRLDGIQVWDWSDPKVRERACEINPLLCGVKLRFDEMYISYSTVSILVGEQAHFLYRMHQNALNGDCRRAVRKMLDEAALRILGEPLDNVSRGA